MERSKSKDHLCLCSKVVCPHVGVLGFEGIFPEKIITNQFKVNIGLSERERVTYRDATYLKDPPLTVKDIIAGEFYLLNIWQ